MASSRAGSSAQLVLIFPRSSFSIQYFESALDAVARVRGGRPLGIAEGMRALLPAIVFLYRYAQPAGRRASALVRPDRIFADDVQLPHQGQVALASQPVKPARRRRVHDVHEPLGDVHVVEVLAYAAVDVAPGGVRFGLGTRGAG